MKDRTHPYHAALREAGPISVMDLEEAKGVTRATLDTSTTIIVATRQAFQVEEEECRKVYQSSGALMHHFDNLSPTQRDELLSDGGGTERTTHLLVGQCVAPAPALRDRRWRRNEPSRSWPSTCWRATARERRHGAGRRRSDLERAPSNVLHSVSAAELKAEEMIKLPVVLDRSTAITNWASPIQPAR